VVTRRLPPSAAAAAEARQAVSDELQSALGDLYDESLRDDALLLTSELVTNAVLHAQTGVSLSVATSDETVRVEVSDGAPVVPEPRVAEVDELGGRGLALVEAIASDWGVRLAPPGKTVWFELRVRRR
jgi:anti-sigma regulatory factor (Ser/Thr protein kinase)